MKLFLYSIKFMSLLLIAGLFPQLVSGQWSSPINLSPNAISALLNESMGPCIGVSGDTVHVVWADRLNTTHGAIYYTQSADTGLTWSSPVAITSTSGNAWNPAIAVNGSSIHVVWREIDTVNLHRSSHYKHSLDGGITWGENVTVDSVVANWPGVAVSGNSVYIVNDIVTSTTPYNTEIFFLKSMDNGTTWGAHQQITFADGRSEDEAITAMGPDVYLSWNDNRTGQMQIYYKHSGNYGQTWDPEVAVIPPFDYGTMVSANGANIDIPCAGSSAGHYQILLVNSADSGTTWGSAVDLTNDPSNTYYYPYMVRDGSDLHLTYVKSGAGGQYLHSGDGGATWDPPYNMGYSNITPFIAYTGCVLHVIIPDSGHINYIRNPKGNFGPHCINTTGISPPSIGETLVKAFPNPVITQSTIQIYSSLKPEETYLEVLDMYGREIKRSTFGTSYKICLDRKLMSPGIYFYEVFQKENVIATGKIIVE